MSPERSKSKKKKGASSRSKKKAAAASAALALEDTLPATKASLTYFQQRRNLWASSPRDTFVSLPPPLEAYEPPKVAPQRLGSRRRTRKSPLDVRTAVEITTATPERVNDDNSNRDAPPRTELFSGFLTAGSTPSTTTLATPSFQFAATAGTSLFAAGSSIPTKAIRTKAVASFSWKDSKTPSEVVPAVKTPNVIDYRQRLTAFYQSHNPEKISTVDATLERYWGREQELFDKLEAKYASYPPAQGKGPEYFLHTSHGRILCRVFADVVPLASANFGSTCTGAPIAPANRSTIITYEKTPWHRIVPGQLIQGGDTTRGDGRGGRSAYDLPMANDMWGHFDDELPFLAHDRAGLLSMANTGPNSNSSQFFITLRAMPHLNGKHVVFGEVVDGMETVRTIGRLATDKQQRPVKEAQIIECGSCPKIEEVVKEIATAPISKPSPVPISSAASSPSPFTSSLDKPSRFAPERPFSQYSFGAPVKEPELPTSASKHPSFFSPVEKDSSFLWFSKRGFCAADHAKEKKLSVLAFSTLYGTGDNSSNSNCAGDPSPIPSAPDTTPPIAGVSAFSLASSPPTSTPVFSFGKAPGSSQVSSKAAPSSTSFGDKITAPMQSSVGLPFVTKSHYSSSDKHSFSEDGDSAQDATFERKDEDGSNEHRISAEAEWPTAEVARSHKDTSETESDESDGLSLSDQTAPLDAALSRKGGDRPKGHQNATEAERLSAQGAPSLKGSLKGCSSVITNEVGDVVARSASPPEPSPLDTPEKASDEQRPMATHLSGSPTKPSEPQAMQFLKPTSHVTSDRSSDLPTKSSTGLEVDSATSITQPTREPSTPSPADQSSDRRSTTTQAVSARSKDPPTDAPTEPTPPESGGVCMVPSPFRQKEPPVESSDIVVNAPQRLLEFSSNEWMMTRYGVWTKREHTVSDAGGLPEPDPSGCLQHNFDPLALRLVIFAGAHPDMNSENTHSMTCLPDRVPVRTGRDPSNHAESQSLGTTLDRGTGVFEVDCRKSEILVFGRQVAVGDGQVKADGTKRKGSETCVSGDSISVEVGVSLTQTHAAKVSSLPAISRPANSVDIKYLSAAEPMLPVTVVQVTSRTDAKDAEASAGFTLEQLPTASSQHPRLAQSRMGNNFLSQPHAILQTATTPVFTFGTSPAFTFDASRTPESWSPVSTNVDSTNTTSASPFTQSLSEGPIKGYNPFAPGPKFKFGARGGEDRTQEGLVSFTSLDSISVTSDAVDAKEDLKGEKSDRAL
jgi:cyclophilin family peptidyl-prolyl cis-trans isomerase